MKRMIPAIFAGMLVLIVIFSACEKVVYPPFEIEPTDSVSYSLDIQPIWDSKCLNCHGSSRSPDLRPDHSHAALMDGAYINTTDPESSELMQKLYGTHDSRASEAEKQKILRWITEGAKDN